MMELGPKKSDSSKKIYPVFFGAQGPESPSFLTWSLRQKFVDRGIQFVELDEADEAWFFDLNPKHYVSLVLVKFRRIKKVLFLFEPRSVNPLQYSSFVLTKFHKVVSFEQNVNALNDSEVGSKFICVPYRGDPNDPLGKRAILNINGKKHSVAFAAGDKQSVHPYSLYWLRRDVIRRLVASGVSVDLAGLGWHLNFGTRLKQLLQSTVRVILSGQVPQFKFARPLGLQWRLDGRELLQRHGWVEDEVEFLASSKVVVVIENDIYFHSEKIYAALATGSVVIYAGPPIRELSSISGVLLAEFTAKSIAQCAQDALSENKSHEKNQNRSLFLAHRTYNNFYEEIAQALAFESRDYV
jgi:hypothetical protein